MRETKINKHRKGRKRKVKPAYGHSLQPTVSQWHRTSTTCYGGRPTATTSVEHHAVRLNQGGLWCGRCWHGRFDSRWQLHCSVCRYQSTASSGRSSWFTLAACGDDRCYCTGIYRVIWSRCCSDSPSQWHSEGEKSSSDIDLYSHQVNFKRSYVCALRRCGRIPEAGDTSISCK